LIVPVRARAGLDDLRVHDLRHAFASVGALLGHRVQTTPSKYAHLSADPGRAAADRNAGPIAAVIQCGGEGGEGIELRKRKV
jgi:hypothetical protein